MGDRRPLPRQPTISVLVRDGGDRPSGMAGVEARAEVLYCCGLDDLRRALSRSHALFVWDFTSTKVGQAWDAASPELRWVHIASTGVDPVLFPALVEGDVTLTNSREIFDDAIAEYVAGAVLALRKDLVRTLDLQRAHDWQHRETRRLAGDAALVVGAGPIGRAIGRLLAGLGCRVRLVARSERPDDPEFGRVHGVEGLEGLVPEADVVVVAVPLTPQTRNLFGADLLARIRPGALFVNVARGTVVDEDALVRTLAEGRLGGAALDVFAREPLGPQHPLWDMSNVIVSPHMAGDFVGWREVLAGRFVDNFHRWVRGEPLESVVDKRLGYVPGPDRGPAPARAGHTNDAAEGRY